MSDTPETDALDCELHNPRVLSDRYSEMVEHAQKLERERDEARQAWYEMHSSFERSRDEAEKLMRERDEARAVAGELADVASKYLSFLLAVTPVKTNETHEKETMRVIDAIKRWKEL